MVKRQLRVGEIVEDYCPRERRLSDHAIVAMVDDDVRQVRCTACDGEHDYRGGKVPVTRRKKTAAAAPPLPPASMHAPAVDPAAADAVAVVENLPADSAEAPAPVTAPVRTPVPTATEEPTAAAAAAPAVDPVDEQDPPQPDSNESAPMDWSTHRRLIRATLPRAEGQVPERRIPEFTMHNPGRGQGGHGRPFRGGHGGQGGQGGGRGASGHGRQGQGQGGGGNFSHGNRQGHGGQHGGGGQNRSSRQGFGGGRPGGGRGKKH